MYRLLAITATFLLFIFVSVPADFSPRADDGIAAFAELSDEPVYTVQKHDEKKFLPQREFSLATGATKFFSFTAQISSIASAPAALKIRDPPAVLASA